MRSSGASRSTMRSKPGAIKSMSTRTSRSPSFFGERIFVGDDIDDHRPIHRKRARQQFFQLARLVDAEGGAAERLTEFGEIDPLPKAPDFPRALRRFALIRGVHQRDFLIERAVVVAHDDAIDAIAR